MIRIARLGVSFEDNRVLGIEHIEIEPGTLCAVIGPTGSGKSTLCNVLAGIIPHLQRATIEGSISIGGIDWLTASPYERIQRVAWTAQQPARCFVTETVRHELGFTLAQLGTAPQLITRRIHGVAELLGISGLLDRSLDTLSSGQQQRVALGAALINEPLVIVLDEPTATLDGYGAHELMSTLRMLTRETDTTVILAEHHVDRLTDVDQIVTLPDGRVGPNPEAWEWAHTQPETYALGNVLGVAHPLTVRAARAALRTMQLRAPEFNDTVASTAPVHLEAQRGSFRLDAQFEAAIDGVTVVIGHNGAGKSTLLESWFDRDRAKDARLLPSVLDGFFLGPSILEDFQLNDTLQGLASGTTAAQWQALGGRTDQLHHSSELLSAGEQLRAALAIVLARPPALLLLDEPTRGLDRASSHEIARLLREHRSGQTIVATHDLEFAALTADWVAVLDGGTAIECGEPRGVLTSTRSVAPVAARVGFPYPFLTMHEIFDWVRHA